MTIKQRALLQTIGILVGIVAASILLTLAIKYIPLAAYPWIALAGLLTMASSLIYGVVLSRLEHEQTLEHLRAFDRILEQESTK